MSQASATLAPAPAATPLTAATTGMPRVVDVMKRMGVGDYQPYLANALGAGVTTVGIPIGVGVIVFTIILTWIYVRRANTEFDAESEAIVKEATK